MARQRQVYETAFDCKINKSSNNDLDNLNKMINDTLIISEVRIYLWILEFFQKFQEIVIKKMITIIPAYFVSNDTDLKV